MKNLQQRRFDHGRNMKISYHGLRLTRRVLEGASISLLQDTNLDLLSKEDSLWSLGALSQQVVQ